jgi:hypothetical protein
MKKLLGGMKSLRIVLAYFGPFAWYKDMGGRLSFREWLKT